MPPKKSKKASKAKAAPTGSKKKGAVSVAEDKKKNNSAAVSAGTKRRRGDADGSDLEGDQIKRPSKKKNVRKGESGEEDGEEDGASKASGNKKPKGPESPSFAGKFDIFSWAAANISLQVIYTGKDLTKEPSVYPELVYARLADNSAKAKDVGRIAVLTLPDDEDDEGRFDGTTTQKNETDSEDEDYEEEEDVYNVYDVYDGIDGTFVERCPLDLSLNFIRPTSSLKFKSDEFEFFPDNGNFDGPYTEDERDGPGIVATLTPSEDACGIESAEGTIKMRRLWVGEGGEELFEGFLTFDVDFNILSKRRYYSIETKRHSGADRQFRVHFWATRRNS